MGRSCTDIHVPQSCPHSAAASDSVWQEWVQAADFLQDEATIAQGADALTALLIEATACDPSVQERARAAKV